MGDKITTVVAGIMLGVVGIFAIMVQPIMAETLVSQLGFSAGNAGIVTAVEALGTALGPVFAVLWMSRVNWRLAAAVAIGIVIAGNLLSASVTDFATLAGLRFAVGLLGQGTAFALAMGVIAGTQGKDRNFAFLIAAQVVLGVVAFLALPFPRGSGVSGVLLPLAGLAALAALTIGWIPQSSSTGSAAHGSGAAATGSAAGGFLALGVMLVWCTGLGAIWAFVKLIGTSGGLAELAVGQALGLSTGIAVIGALGAAALGDRFGRIAPVTVALLVQLAMVLLLQGEFSWVQFAVTAAVFQTFWNLTGPYLMGTIALSDPTGKASLLIPTAQIGGFFLGPVLVSTLMRDGNLTMANTVGAVCIVLALLLFIPTARRVGKPA
jgi:predicted MFS family arabinose efflux permease